MTSYSLGVRPRAARLTAALLAGALLASVPPAASQPVRNAAATTATCPESDGWALGTTRIDAADTHHAFVGNGYLGQRVPPNGAGYADSTAKTGWPLFTPSYDGSFVSGLYAHNKQTAGDRQAVAALPTWTALAVGTG